MIKNFTKATTFWGFTLLVSLLIIIVVFRLPLIYNRHYVYLLDNKSVQSSPILIDLRDFKYVINNNVCSNKTVFLITYVHSALQNYHHRITLRATWGFMQTCNLLHKMIFVLGITRNKTLQNLIEYENSLYHDIVQGNFIDSYKNLTYKNVMGLKWVSEFCPHAHYVLKTDDDIVIDMFRLYYEIRQLYQEARDFIACNVWINMPVYRNPKTKWYISEEDHPDTLLSPFCSGWAYLLTPEVAKGIYLQSSKHKYLYIDDFTVTGPILDNAGFRRLAWNHLYTFSWDPLGEWLNSTTITKLGYLVGCTVGHHQMSKELWYKIVITWLPDLNTLCSL